MRPAPCAQCLGIFALPSADSAVQVFDLCLHQLCICAAFFVAVQHILQLVGSIITQAGLSPRTIRRVTEKLDNVVLPYVDDLRNPDGGLKNAGNAQHVRDGDIWVQEYLTGHGIPCYEIGEVET